MSSCRLIEQSEFINDMNSLIASATNFKDYIDEFKSGLITLKSKYKEMTEFEESVREYLEDDRGHYQISYIDEKIADNLRSAIDSIFRDIPQMEERGSKFDSLSPSTETSQIRQQFLDKYFRISSFSKLTFLRNFKNDIVRKVFLSDKVDSIEDLNESIQEFRESLKNQIIETLNKQDSDACKKAAKRFEQLYNLNLHSAINLIQRIFDNESIFSPILIAKLPEIETLSEEGQNLLKGWQAYVTLSNFDDLLVTTFKKAIEIKNHGEYNLDNSNKYNIKTADRVIETWRDENVDVDETEELSNLAVLVLSSLKVVDKAGNYKQEDLEFQNVKISIGNLMKVLDTHGGNIFMYNEFPSQTFNSTVISVLKSEYGDLYGEAYLDDILKRYVFNKNFKQVLAATKEHAQILMPILFRLTQPVISNKIDVNPYSNIFSKQLKTNETLRSLYYQVFSPNADSIFNMNQTENIGFNPNRRSIYQYLTTLILNIENKQQIEYQKTEDGISVTNLGLKTNETRLRSLIRSLEGKFNKVNPLGLVNDNEITFNSFKMTDNLLGKDKTLPKGLMISTDKYRIYVKPNMEIEVQDSDGKILSPEKIDYNSLFPIFQEVLDIEFNPTFLSTFNSLDGNKYKLLGLVSHILYNYQVGKHMINYDIDQYNDNISDYYDYGIKKLLTKTPKIIQKSIQPSIILPIDLTIMKVLSKTKDNIEGYSEVNTVMDGERKQISTLGLPCMLARFSEIIENYGKREDSAIKHLSIFDMFEGAEYMRDYAEPGNNKQAKQFTESELITASILYDMYGELNKLEEGNPVENQDGILRVMGPVISDKGNLIKLKFKWNSVINPKYVKVLRPENPNTVLRLRDLTIPDLKYIIKQDFGEYFRNVVNYINSQYNVLNDGYIDYAIDSLGLNLPKGIKLDYLTDFAEANSAFTIEGKNYILPILREAIYIAQNSGENVEIIDQVHYITDKSGNLHNNKTLLHQYSLFNNEQIESQESFWSRKEKQLFIDFLQSETELSVKNGNVNKPGIAILTAISKNQGWIKGEDIAVAKVTNGEYSSLIATKADFKNWFPYKLLREAYNNNLPPELDIDNPDVSLDAIIEVLKTQSIKRKVIEKLNDIIKSNPYIISSNKQAELLEEAFNEYRRKRLTYNQDLSEEQLQQSWERRVQKDFIKDGKIDKQALKEYIVKSKVQRDIDIRFDNELYGLQDWDISYLEDFLEEADSFNVEINPEIIKHNLFDFYLGEEFVLATTGTWAAHPAKASNLIEREAEQFGQAVKRYVAYTASMHREELNTLNGIPEDLTIAIIEDAIDYGYNFVGEKGKIKVYDGATFYCNIMNYLDNNSLGADAMGVDKKSFGHYQGIQSGIGFILKTAGFALTNARIRSSESFDARLNKMMLDVKWNSPKIQKLLGGETLDWTKDYFEKDINYGEWYAYDQDEEGTWRWFKRRVNKDTRNIEQIHVYSNGEEYNEDWIPYTKTINSNYDLWQAFGGAYSGHLERASNGTYYLEYDENSVQMLVKAVNNVGIRRKVNGKYISKVFDQDGVNQVLKKACIHIIPTGGAVKYGGANINSSEAYYNDDYHLTTMNIKAYNLGEQLNAEHTAEDSHVALMTQVINALTARGYSYYEGKQCYEALAAIAEYISGNVLEAMETDDPSLIEEVLNKSIYKTLLKVSSTDGDILNALAGSIFNMETSSVDRGNILRRFPISHPAVFSKVMSSLASQLEKAIKLQFEGGMEVLNPSNRRFTLIGGKLSGYYETHIDELIQLEEKNKLSPLTSPADIKLGYNYRNSLTGELFQVNSPKDFYTLKNRILNGEIYYETVLTKSGETILPLGRDLATYQLSFTANGERYSSWELDSVRMLQDLDSGKDGFLIPNNKTNEEKVAFMANLQRNWDTLSDFQKAYNAYKHPELISQLNTNQQEELSFLTLPIEIVEQGVTAEDYLKDRFQKELNALSSGIETTVQVNGYNLTVDKSRTQVNPFEIVLPMIYKTMFGLREGDSVEQIENNKNFFIERQLENWKAKISDQEVFDIELKTLDGNHIYLGLPPEDLLSDDYQPVNLEFPVNFELDGDILYRITPLGKRLYSVPYTTTEAGIVPDIQVYKHKATGTEIIYSNNLTHFLDEFSYNKIVFSNQGTQDKIKLLQQLNNSTNSTARRKISVLLTLANQRVNRKLSNTFKGIEDRQSIIDNLIQGLFNLEDDFDEALENGTLEELIQFNPEELVELIETDYDFTEQQVDKLKADLANKLQENELIRNNKFFKGLILSGIEVHTSFLQSLEMVVSRTPSQSHQSFMAMKVAAFGPEKTNSAYVSRDQLWLQGSDYDIDKISLLGLKFKFGKLITWSPFFSLRNDSVFQASKKLPFPTSKELQTIKALSDVEKIELDRLQHKSSLSNREKESLANLSARQITIRPYDVIRNDFIIRDEENGITVSLPSGNALMIQVLPNNDINIIANNWENTPKLERYLLLRRVRQELEGFDGIVTLDNFDIGFTTRDAIGLSGDGRIGDINFESDFIDFNNSILPEYVSEISQVKYIQDNIIQLAPELGILLQVYNKIGYIPETSDNYHAFVKQLVDYHNVSIKNGKLKDALYNFVSIKAKDISKDPINRIQAQAPIDPQMDKIKVLVEDSEKYPEFQKLAGFIKKFDRGSVYSKFKMVTITLGGKDGVGIEASSLKNFEMSSQYNYSVLEEGTAEDQRDLLFRVKINGREVNMLANVRVRNEDTIKDPTVLEALRKVDQYRDEFLTKSGLLSLSTDNAKDPKLPQLNCGKKMLPLYDAGVNLGFSMEELAKIILSKTGILINRLASGNIFNGQPEKTRIIDIIRELQGTPRISFSKRQLEIIKSLLVKLGIYQEDEAISNTSLSKKLANSHLRGQFLQIFRFLQTPNAESSILKQDKEKQVNNIIANLKNSKAYTKFGTRSEQYLNELSAKERTEEEEQKYQDLLERQQAKKEVLEKIKSWREYLETGILGNSDILQFNKTFKELENTSFDEQLKGLRNLIFESKFYLDNIKAVYNWLSAQEIIDSDYVNGYDGEKHKVIRQLFKLAEISEEQGALRFLMALNQKLPNKIEEQLEFYTNFSKILSDRLEIIGKSKLERYYREAIPELEQLARFNEELRTNKIIYSENPYYVDLHTFLYNPEYNALVKSVYGKVKCTTNIFKVIDSIPNYKKYIRLADSLIKLGTYSTQAYRTLKLIEEKILPSMNTRKATHLNQMRKNGNSCIYKSLNQEFLRSQDITLEVPRFKIVDGKLTYLEGKPQLIQLGINERDDQKFKDYVQYIVFPELKRSYPDNKFIQYLGYRSYDYNADHNTSINLAKIKTSDMNITSDIIQFDLAKYDLQQLPVTYVNYLFYYNLLAYNNQPGQLSLTSLFEDLILHNQSDVIKAYNDFIVEWGKSDSLILDEEKIKASIAPVLKLYEISSKLRLPYIYVENPEDKKTYFAWKEVSDNQQNPEDQEDQENYGYGDNDEGYPQNEDIPEEPGEERNSRKKTFREIMKEAGYHLEGIENNSDTSGIETEITQFGRYKITSKANLQELVIMDGDKVYTSQDILKIAKEKNIKLEDKEVKKLSQIFTKKAKKYDLDRLKTYLDVILHDDTTC